jgi:hypothetical protein
MEAAGRRTGVRDLLVPDCNNSRAPFPHGHGSETLSEPRALASGTENRGYGNFRNSVLDDDDYVTFFMSGLDVSMSLGDLLQ